ncbi:MAG: DUF72 domain-containing protein [Bacteroidota bacterium]
MKFGSVTNPEEIDFTLPEDHPETANILSKSKAEGKPELFVGCAKWNRQDLKGFYPRGTKDELAYYSQQFNSIELNATFYNSYGPEQMETWRNKTPEGFKFFPKVPQYISHLKRLNDVGAATTEFCDSITHFEDKLGMAFLQLHNNFAPKNFERLERFLDSFPDDIPLGVEVRHTDWLNDPDVSLKFYGLLERNNHTNIITDTAGRRDLIHMRLTSPYAFVRYVGANHESDYTRLDDWLNRIELWINQGVKGIYFFVHQNIEKESPLLSTYFIEKLNKAFGYDLKTPNSGTQNSQLSF